MQDTVFLVVNNKQVVSMHKRDMPAQRSGEYVFALEVNVPDEIFRKRPVPVVQVTLEAPHVASTDVQIGSVDAIVSVDAIAHKQAVAQRVLGDLIVKSQRSTDVDLQSAAKDALDLLFMAGVDFKVVSETEEVQP